MTKCLICEEKAELYFKADVQEKLAIPFKINEYYQCTNCKFVFSKSVYELNTDEFAHINNVYNTQFYTRENDFSHNPPYLQQAVFFQLMANHALVDNTTMLDYAAGLGSFSTVMKSLFNKDIYSYDAYLVPENRGYITKEEMHNKSFSTVFSSAFLEHIRNFDEIEEMLAVLDDQNDKSVFAFHTLVCENPPKDPKWFYYNLLHCSIFSNASMEFFMQRFGFVHSIYSPLAKTWLFYKDVDRDFERKVFEINESLKSNYLYYKKGFMDYWK